MFKLILIISFLVNIFEFSSGQCLVATQPSDLLSCISIDAALISSLVQNKNDLTQFCKSAQSYLSCMRPFFTDCIGGKVATGALDEIMDLNRKCCILNDTTNCVTKSIFRKT